jgi:hypothetical protein
MNIKKYSCCKWAWLLALGIVVIALLLGAIARSYQFWDDASDRGATFVTESAFGDAVTEIRYLDQGWKPSESLWFYNTTQGSNIMPYDFFLVLEQAGKTELFRDNKNMDHYRYLVQQPTSSNPKGLPVGFVKDTYQDKDYVGLTCAACHTGQVNYKGVGMRIDGGPAGADMNNMLTDLAKSMEFTLANEEAKKRFVKNVQALGTYDSEKEILKDLEKFTQRLRAYWFINHSPVKYGYARLDAFGRIYNRVLEHTLNATRIRDLLELEFDKAQMDEILKGENDILTGEQRDDLIYRIAQKLHPKDQVRLRNRIFNRPDAPVSYPFLWDIPQHDYVQWNALASNGGLGPVGRNAGEVIGVFGTLDWKEGEGPSISAWLSGQNFLGTHVNYKSSVNVRNLGRLEKQLMTLHSPKWCENVLPAIDQTLASRGAKLFDAYCVGCHQNIERTDPERRIVASMTRVADLGTDSKMAENATKYSGYSGITRNGYVSTDVGNILLNERAPAAAILTKATLGVVATPDPDKWFLRRWAEWAYDLVWAFFDNEIKTSVKSGNYDPDTTASPYASLMAYKGRSLNGIWATGPYLHNGSVPTLHDLLLPHCPPPDLKKENGSAKLNQPGCRPTTFQVGSREFDPVKVGFLSSDYKGFTFDTRVPGNYNTGHDYGIVATYGSEPTEQAKAQCEKLKAGVEVSKVEMKDKKGRELLCPLTPEQRLDLVEYMKSL